MLGGNNFMKINVKSMTSFVATHADLDTFPPFPYEAIQAFDN